MIVNRRDDVPLHSIYVLPSGGTFWADKDCQKQLTPGIYVNTKHPEKDEALVERHWKKEARCESE